MLRIPERINDLTEVYRPYLKNGEMLPDAPEEAKKAWEEVKAWYSEYEGDQ